jgi:hypothetical protein
MSSACCWGQEMKRGSAAARAFLVLSIAASTTAVFAEVSVNEIAGTRTLIHIFGIQSGPDPLPQFGIVRQISAAQALNPNGDGFGDRDPDMVFRLSGNPTAVWEHWDGVDYEIAFSEWTAGAWTPTVLLTNNSVDDLDPSVVTNAAGKPIVTWWRVLATPAVFTTRRLTSWEAESQVSLSGVPAKKPTVSIGSDTLTRFSYQALSGGSHQVYVTRDTRGQSPGVPNYVTEIVATTLFATDAEPIIERRRTLTWVTWVHSASQVGWSRLESGTWTAPAFESYSGPADVEAARFRIKNQLP